MTKQHHLEGTTHEAVLDGNRVLTTWTTKKSDATRKAEEFRINGALLTRVFSDGRTGFRIVGFFEII